jgi:molybdenum ABC transporter molybdate-binding protein
MSPHRKRMAWVVAAVLVALVLLILYAEPLSSRPALVLLAAEDLRQPVAALAANFERETGQRVELRFDSSQALCNRLLTDHQGDLLLPADQSYLQGTQASGYVLQAQPLARTHAVLVVPPDAPDQFIGLADLTADTVKLAQADPQSDAVGKLTWGRLAPLRWWDKLDRRTTTYYSSASQVAQAVSDGLANAGIVWAATAKRFPQLTVVRLPELAEVVATIELAVLSTSQQPDRARLFLQLASHPRLGLAEFTARGYDPVPAPAPAP